MLWLYPITNNISSLNVFAKHGKCPLIKPGGSKEDSLQPDFQEGAWSVTGHVQEIQPLGKKRL